MRYTADAAAHYCRCLLRSAVLLLFLCGDVDVHSTHTCSDSSWALLFVTGNRTSAASSPAAHPVFAWFAWLLLLLPGCCYHKQTRRPVKWRRGT